MRNQSLWVPIVVDAQGFNIVPNTDSDRQGPESDTTGSVYGVIEVMNSLNDRAFSDDALAQLIKLADRIAHGVFNIVKLQESESGETKTSAASAEERRPFLAHLTLDQRKNLPRPKSSPERRLHTVNTSALDSASTLTARKSVRTNQRFSFGDMSEYTSEQRLSIMLYQQNQAAQRNRHRPDRVSKIASMLDKYDRDNGIRRLSPKRKSSILWGNTINTGLSRSTRSEASLVQRQTERARNKRNQSKKWFKGFLRSKNRPGRS